MLRAALEDAYDESVQNGLTLRQVLRSYETAARKSLSGGSLKSVSANGRMTVFQDGDPQSDVVDQWRTLIDSYDQAKSWLEKCATYGLDPDDYERDGISSFPDPVANPTAITDLAIKDWMMARLVPITEFRQDHTYLRCG